MTTQELVARARAELDPYAYRLFDYYLASGGTCDEGIRETAERCKMSRSRALAARHALIAGHYIVTAAAPRNGLTVQLTVSDLGHSEPTVPYLEQSSTTVPEMEQTTVPDMSQSKTTVSDLGQSGTATVPEMEQSEATLAGAREKESFNALESLSIPEQTTDKDKQAAAGAGARARGRVLELPERPNAFRVFEENIHMLTPVVADTLKDALAEYPAGWTEDAIREAALSGGKTVKYVIGILERWRKEGRAAKPLAKPASRASPPPETPFAPVGIPADVARKLRNGTL